MHKRLIKNRMPSFISEIYELPVPVVFLIDSGGDILISDRSGWRHYSLVGEV